MRQVHQFYRHFSLHPTWNGTLDNSYWTVHYVDNGGTVTPMVRTSRVPTNEECLEIHHDRIQRSKESLR